MSRLLSKDDRWLTGEEMYKYLTVSNETIYTWIEQHSMPGHRVGRLWMCKKEAVDSWCDLVLLIKKTKGKSIAHYRQH